MMTSNETPKLGAGGLAAGGAVIAVVLAAFGWWMTQDDAPIEAKAPVSEPPSQVVAPKSSSDDVASPPEPDPADVSTAAIPPRFDVVRVEPDGASVIAGQATPGSKVELLVDGQPVSTTQTDANGNFVALFTLAPSDTPRVMSLLVDGKALQSSEQSVIVGPTTAPKPEADTTSVTAAMEAPVPGGATGDTAPEVAVEAPVEQPESPQVLLADQDGIVVIQGAGESGEAVDVSLDSISYDETGAVALAGRGAATQTVRIYLDDARIAEGLVSENGQWRVTLNDVDAGIYTMRIEALDDAENVISRLETPFKREDPAQLASLSEVPADAQAGQANESANALAASKEPAINDVKIPNSDGASGTTTNALEVAVATGTNGQENPATMPATQEDAEIALTEDALPAPARVPSAAAQLDAEQDEGDVASVATNPIGQVASRPRVVTVQAGATLWAIARDNLGKGTLYVQVFDANRDKISNPDLIYPGQVFAVPGQQ